jgi:hypothetical protein
MKRMHIDGYNLDISSGTEDVYPGATVPYVHPSAAATTTIVSDSGDDDVAGTGALTVLVEGTGDSHEFLSEIATMTGAVAVTLSNSYRRINKIQVLTAGSGLENAGIITVLHGAVVIGHLGAGFNKSQMGIFTPYANITRWQIRGWHTGVSNSVVGGANFVLWTRKSGELWEPVMSSDLHGTFAPYQHINFSVPIDLVPGEDIKTICTTTAASSAVTVGYDMVAGAGINGK